MKKLIVLIILIFLISCAVNTEVKLEKTSKDVEEIPETKEQAIKKQLDIVKDLSTVTKNLDDIGSLLD